MSDVMGRYKRMFGCQMSWVDIKACWFRLNAWCCNFAKDPLFFPSVVLEGRSPVSSPQARSCEPAIPPSSRRPRPRLLSTARCYTYGGQY